jgi:hypothetical protein
MPCLAVVLRCVRVWCAGGQAWRAGVWRVCGTHTYSQQTVCSPMAAGAYTPSHVSQLGPASASLPAPATRPTFMLPPAHAGHCYYFHSPSVPTGNQSCPVGSPNAQCPTARCALLVTCTDSASLVRALLAQA